MLVANFCYKFGKFFM